MLESGLTPSIQPESERPSSIVAPSSRLTSLQEGANYSTGLTLKNQKDFGNGHSVWGGVRSALSDAGHDVSRSR